MSLTEKNVFIDKLKYRGVITSPYSIISNPNSNKTLYTTSNIEQKESNALTKLITLFPTYFSFNLESNKNLKVIKIKQQNLPGLAIKTDNYNDINSFMSDNFTPKVRTSIRRSLKGLETCFDIKYKMVFGETSHDDYTTIMESLKTLLTKRFNQRNEVNVFLNIWDDNFESIFKLINKKKASLFVIYADEKIIGVSVNYHFKNIFIGDVIAYDIDFSKFGVGNTIIYKLVEWCLNNNYSLYDFGNGDLAFKKRWSNLFYSFEYHVFYNKNSLLSYLTAIALVFQIKIKNLLKLCNVQRLYEYLKNTSKGKKIEIKNNYVLNNIEKIEKYEKLEQINISDASFSHLRKLFYTFLYTNNDHIKNVRILKNTDKHFFFIGKNKSQEIIFN
ncbi:GNAT family N-acetyltransferase [Thalassobellus sediminis]|uniref:GNAT family N-acetyltransferase n=1 Tax=Thalassobellus sediminis TaxID=3367753 RepID=UPI0037B2B8E0